MDKKSMQHRTVILIATGFDEEAVVPCLCQMRQQGTAVDLIGVPSNLVVGSSGLTVHPDYSLTYLNQTTFLENSYLLIIPGGPSCTNTLLSDPRVHRAIKKTFIHGGSIATMSSNVPEILMNIGLLEPLTTSRFLVQGSLSTPDFVRFLINHTI